MMGRKKVKFCPDCGGKVTKCKCPGREYVVPQPYLPPSMSDSAAKRIIYAARVRAAEENLARVKADRPTSLTQNGVTMTVLETGWLAITRKKAYPNQTQTIHIPNVDVKLFVAFMTDHFDG